MEKVKLIGVGCFGKPDRVARLFDKISQNYKMIYEIPCLPALQNAFGSESGRIAGFSFGYKDQALRISLFVKSGWRSPGHTSSITYPVARKNTRLH